MPFTFNFNKTIILAHVIASLMITFPAVSSLAAAAAAKKTPPQEKTSTTLLRKDLRKKKMMLSRKHMRNRLINEKKDHDTSVRRRTSSTKAPSVTPISCSPSQTKVEVSIVTDDYPSETTWTLETSDGDIIRFGGPYDQTFTNYDTDLCVEASNCYTFTIKDSYGDGLFEGGSVVVKADDIVMLSTPDGGTSFSSLDVDIGQSCSPKTKVEVSIITDDYPSETTWTLENASTGDIIVRSGGPYDQTFTNYDAELYVDASNCYTFTIKDSYGDGFLESGSVVVKADDTVMLSTPFAGGTSFSSLDVDIGASCSPKTKVEVSITTDNYPGETTWTLENTSNGGEIIAIGGPYYDQMFTTFDFQLYVDASNCYTFTIKDSYGDGFLESGSVVVKADDTVMLSTPDGGSSFSSLDVGIGQSCP